MHRLPALPFALPFALLTLVGCDDDGSTVDAGADAAAPPAIVVAVEPPSLVESVPSRSGGAIAPSTGDRFYLMSVTITANAGDPVPVAPNAFRLTLEDDRTINASPMATNGTTDGCDSRSVPVGESTTCNVAFEVTEPAPAPRSLTWSDGIRTVTVRVPPAA